MAGCPGSRICNHSVWPREISHKFSALGCSLFLTFGECKIPPSVVSGRIVWWCPVGGLWRIMRGELVTYEVGD